MEMEFLLLGDHRRLGASLVAFTDIVAPGLLTRVVKGPKVSAGLGSDQL